MQVPPSPLQAEQLVVGSRRLDIAARRLTLADGTPVDLRPQAWQVLEMLLHRRGALVTKDALMTGVWAGTVVTDDSLVQAIGDIRRALGDADHRIVRTVPRRGYLLDATAVSAPGPELPQSAPPTRRGRRALSLGAAGVAAIAIIAYGQAWLAGRDPRAPDAIERATPTAQVQWTIPDRPSIAVLVFGTAGPGQGPDSLLGQGFSEDILGELARNVDLRVVSPQSSLALAGRSLSPAEIGRLLRVRYFVEGSVRRTEDRLTLRVGLVDAHDGRAVWVERYEPRANELPAVREQLAKRIAGSVHSSMRLAQERGSLAPAPASLDIYATVLRGIALKHLFQPDAMREARRLLEQATRMDPQYAPAWLYLGMVNAIDGQARLTGDIGPEQFDEVLAPIERAIALDPWQPQAYGALSLAMTLLQRWEGARAAADQCVRLAPADADCLFYRAKSSFEMGDVEAAREAMARALDLSPLPPVYIQAFHAAILWAQERHEEALHEADECLRRAPAYATCRAVRLTSLAETGRTDAAREEAARLRVLLPGVDQAFLAHNFAPQARMLVSRRLAAGALAGLTAPAPATATRAAGR